MCIPDWKCYEMISHPTRSYYNRPGFSSSDGSSSGDPNLNPKKEGIWYNSEDKEWEYGTDPFDGVDDFRN